MPEWYEPAVCASCGAEMLGWRAEETRARHGEPLCGGCESEPERVYALHPGPAPRFAAEEQGYGRVAMPPYPDDKGPPIRLTLRNRLSADEA